LIAFFYLLPGQDFLKGVLSMAISALKVPTLNQLITLAIALVILFLILGFAPENVKKFFRV